jgi:hypothetical protein
MIRPAQLTRDQLAAVLREIADGFESGDTLEGHVEFLVGDGVGLEGGATWDVRGAYRTGNREGQGGLRFVGDITVETSQSNPIASLVEATQLVRMALSTAQALDRGAAEAWPGWADWVRQAEAWARSQP